VGGQAGRGASIVSGSGLFFSPNTFSPEKKKWGAKEETKLSAITCTMFVIGWVMRKKCYRKY